MDTTLHILYVGGLWDGSTCKMRLEAFREIGHIVETLDTRETSRPGSIRSFFARLCNQAGYPPDFNGINKSLVDRVAENRPDIVWIDDVRLIGPSTLKAAGAASPSTLFVGFIMDNPFSSRPLYWQRFYKAVPHYDLHFAIRDDDTMRLKKMGAPAAFRYHKGFSPDIHKPMPEVRQKPSYDVFFAGHYEPKRETDLVALLNGNIPLTIAGHRDWKKGANWKLIQKAFIDGGFYGTQYTRVLNASKIALCFYSQWNRDTENSRMYEIPACGVFMLAERNRENVTVFKEGEEAEYFGSPEELLEKVRYYLDRPDERKRIAEAGRNRCITGGYSYHNRLRHMLSDVLKLKHPAG